MSWMSRRSWSDQFQDDVAHHLSALRREIRSLGGQAGRYARNEEGELGEALMHSGIAAGRQLARQAKRTGAAIKRDPVPAMAGAIVVACFASLLMGGRKGRKR
jgi:hypothetical protein